ncbi:MAG: tRNA epoxyqueuosine(34) reductase QueG [Hyphomicrobiaceae bacterium]|nr:tRNA epoxyqueuosine(34) reductase QueG [Hyphomicrobiaceae bacterium]
MPTSISEARPGSDAARVLPELAKRAQSLGFSVVGIAGADSRPDLPARLRHALAEGHHAGMIWLAQTEARRADPKILWPEVKSIIMLGTNYGPPGDPLADLAATGRGNISVYARRRDYHDVIKGRLKDLAGFFAASTGAEVKVFVDTAPVMEKPLAEAAGLGWQGKHTALVSRAFGSWLFLGAIFTNADLPASKAHPESCGRCTKCLDICPTDAFPAPFELDARKCLAYYSNEHHGIIPRRFRAPMGNRIFGCDDCLAVCPWNKFAETSRDIKLSVRAELVLPELADLLALDEAGFRSLARGSPLRRLGYARFLRNVLIAAGNSENEALMHGVKNHLSNPDPVVRASAVWALSQLMDVDHFSALREATIGCESDADVRTEWQSAPGAASTNGDLDR